MVAVFAFSACAQISVLENSPFVLEWIHQREDNETYRVYLGTNAVQNIRTNDFKLMSETNGITTLRASINGLPRGTNILTMTAVAGWSTNIESLPSTNVVFKIIARPATPYGIKLP